ncbi:MAG: hypothetical protein BWY58_01233 [Chloroflexi bacterium ADurb.Bin344]|nr:MAG: hypothetical protein BWY58_01233 [Chloroflexi bacterium ADurb.Bin344]
MTPRSNSVAGGFKTIRLATCPKAVADPVFITMHLAYPELTVVPIKTTLFIASNSAFSADVPAVFSTGKVSPVNTDWFTKKSSARRIIASAGIILPAESSMISPGTITSAGTDFFLPSRMTSVLIFNRICIISAALSALNSWIKERTALNKIITKIMIASTQFPNAAEITVAINKINKIGLLN